MASNKLHAPANDAAGFRALISACEISAADVPILLTSRGAFIAAMGTNRACKRCENVMRKALAAHNPAIVHERYTLGYYLISR